MVEVDEITRLCTKRSQMQDTYIINVRGNRGEVRKKKNIIVLSVHIVLIIICVMTKAKIMLVFQPVYVEPEQSATRK